MARKGNDNKRKKKPGPAKGRQTRSLVDSELVRRIGEDLQKIIDYPTKGETKRQPK